MTIKSKIYSTCLLSMLAVSCSKDDGGDSKKQPNSEETLSNFDAKSFKNTKSKDEAIAKANETSSIFDGLKANNRSSSIRSNLLSVDRGENGNPRMDEYEIFGQHYDYKNFKSCSDYIRVYH